MPFGPDDMQEVGIVECCDMVNMAFDHLTFDWRNAYDHVSPNTTHRGISWRKLDETTFCVTHNMPPVVLTQYFEQDRGFLNEPGNFTTFDRGWQSILLKEGRLKVIPSSDMFFSVELTPDEGVEYPMFDNQLYNDQIREPECVHNFSCNSFFTIWRGRPKS
jgi:hypothetical protein